MLYGGSAPKGQNTDPRSGKARQEQMRSGGRGGGDRRSWLIWFLAVLVVVLAAVVVVLVVTGGGDEPRSDTTVPGVRSVVGQLDCTPNEVVEQQVAAEGRNPREALLAVNPTVVSVAQDPVSSDRVWGYAADQRVVGLAHGA